MRRWIIAGVAVVAVVVVAHTLLWGWAARRLDAGFEAWEANLRAAGWSVTHDPDSGGGWPAEVSLLVPNLKLVRGEPDAAGGVILTADRVTLRVALQSPHTLRLAFGGVTHVRVGTTPELAITAARLTATLPLDPNLPTDSVDIHGEHLRAGTTESAADAASVALMSLHGEQHPDAGKDQPALAFAGSAQDVTLPPPPQGQQWPLGPRIASVSVEGALDGPLPPPADFATMAARWRDGGGTLRIGRFAIGWGPLGLSGTATLSLDADLQPTGTAQAHIVGQSETLDTLAAAHAITPNAALAAKAVLGLMARTPPGGGAPEVNVPVTLKNRVLDMGEIPLTRVPELVWPQARG